MYKFITGLPAKPISYSPILRSVKGIKYIVVHFTGNYSDTAYNNARFFNSTNKEKVGAHLFIDDNYLYQSITPDKIAYSVGKKYGIAKLWGKCTNANSISIELCSKDGLPTEATLNNAEIAIMRLMNKYHIPVERVIRHFDVAGKLCPGWPGWSGNDSSEWFRFKSRFYSIKDKIENL